MNLDLVKLSAVALLLFVIVSGCKKDDSAKPLQGVYQISNTINLSTTVMYTVNGKITDQNIIAAYIKRHGSLTAYGYSYFVLNTIPSDITDQIRINFMDENNATWTDPESDTTLISKFTVTNKTNTGFVLEAVDSGFTTSYGNQQKVQTLLANSNSINTVSNCKFSIYVSDYDQRCTFRQAYPFIIKNGHIYLQLYNCSITSYTNTQSYSSSAVGGLPGIFNESIAKQLDATDTLVYQARTILFNKQ